jgi:hypothetical protein
LRERGVIAQEQGRWALTQSVADIRQELPESVRSMIERKIDQLSEADRRLLVAASVQGYEFDGAVMARVLGIDAVDIEEQLDVIDVGGFDGCGHGEILLHPVYRRELLDHARRLRRNARNERSRGLLIRDQTCYAPVLHCIEAGKLPFLEADPCNSQVNGLYPAARSCCAPLWSRMRKKALP